MKKRFSWVNRRLLFAVTLLSLLAVGYETYNRLVGASDQLYEVAVYMTQDGARLGWMYDYESLPMWVLLCSMVFLLLRLHGARVTDGRRREELIASYPVKRREAVRQNMLHTLFYPGVMLLIMLAGMGVTEGIAYGMMRRRYTQVTLNEAASQNMSVFLLLGFLLFAAMAWAFFCETVTTNKYIGLLLGAIVVALCNLGAFNSYSYWTFYEGIKALRFRLLVIGGACIVCLIVGALLIRISIRLYERRELSVNGVFYFPFAKDLFLALAGIPLLLVQYSLYEGMDAGFGSAGEIIAIGCAVVVGAFLLNYLVLPQGIRSNAKKLCLSAVRSLGAFVAVAALGILLYLTCWMTAENLLIEKQQEYSPYANTGSYELSQEEVLDRENWAQRFDWISEDYADVLFPDMDETWAQAKEVKGYLAYEDTGYGIDPADGQMPVAFRGYQIWKEGSEGMVSYSMDRFAKGNSIITDVITADGMERREDERYGTVYLFRDGWGNSMRAAEICVSREDTDYFDIYTVWERGADSEEELIELLHSLH